MPRVISFIVLLAIILLVGAVFFQVMAQFIVPLFLACVLLVVFQPLHRRILSRLPKHPRVSALITTVLILLAVLLPLVWLGWNAYDELHTIFATGHKPDAASAAPTVKNNGTNPKDPDESKQNEKPDAASAVPTVKNNGTNAKEPDQSKPNEVAFSDQINNIAFQLRDDLHRYTPIFIDDDAVKGFVSSGQKFLATKALSGVQSMLGILVGLAITVISLYYFLADGPAMINTAMDLSPLDASYEQELLERFGDVSRAVVVATLLSALVQGTLAGIGYYFALPITAPIFLLTALTMVTALVPFVGAAATWICVCGYVYFYGERIVEGQVTQGNPSTAIILAIYCTVVVSGIDNVIKPFILHGQSKLHPLLALLSILGGMQVLGPVGILVGPMLVSFLQALLNMLRKELDLFGGSVVEGSKPLAESMTDAIQMVTDENAEQQSQTAAEQAAKAATHQGAKSTPALGKTGPARRSKRKR